MAIKIGAHFDTPNVIADAQAAGAQVAQIFLADPQKWKIGEVNYPGGAAGLRDAAREAGIDLYVHAPYLINVASANNKLRIPSRKLLQATARGAEQIGAKGVIVHGGHVAAAKKGAAGKGKGGGKVVAEAVDDDAAADDFDDATVAGFIAWRKAFDALDTEVPILIENTAGGSGAMARTLDRIALLWQAISSSENAKWAGFTLDTCHAWAAGLDLKTLVSDIEAITGRIDLVHANDSIGGPGSNLDRHTNFGQGTIPPELLVDVCREAGAPIVCETHGDVGTDIAWLRHQLR